MLCVAFATYSNSNTRIPVFFFSLHLFSFLSLSKSSAFHLHKSCLCNASFEHARAMETKTKSPFHFYFYFIFSGRAFDFLHALPADSSLFYCFCFFVLFYWHLHWMDAEESEKDFNRLLRNLIFFLSTFVVSLSLWTRSKWMESNLVHSKSGFQCTQCTPRRLSFKSTIPFNPIAI